MKKFLRKPFFAALFSVACGSVTSCFIPYYQSTDLGGNEINDEVTSTSDTRRMTLGNLEDDEEGITPYAENFLSLTYKATSHWVFNSDYEPNQNGGFILNLTGDEPINEILAQTTVQQTDKLVGNKKLVLSAKADSEQVLVFGITDSKHKTREIEVQLNEVEQKYELFVAELDLANGFDVYIKANSTQEGKATIRDIHFSYFYTEDGQINPYAYESEEELNLCRNIHDHWETMQDYEIDYRSVDQFDIKYVNDEDKELYIKTTVAGNKDLAKFKSVVFAVKLNNTSFENVKLRVGNDEIEYGAYSSSGKNITISLENINVEENFDIYFIFGKKQTSYNSVTTINVQRVYLSQYVAAPNIEKGTADNFDLLHNSFYHVDVSDYHETLQYGDNNKVTLVTSPDTKNDTYIYSKFVNVAKGDYYKARFLVRGIEGNVIKIGPIEEGPNNTSGMSQTEVTLTGEEQEVEITFQNQYSTVTGFYITVNASTNNVPGTFELMEAEYTSKGDGLYLKNIRDKIGPDVIDITDDIKDYWQYGSNTTISEDGIVNTDFTGDNPEALKLHVRRDAAFSEYTHLVATCYNSSTINYKYVNNYEGNSTFYTSGTVQTVHMNVNMTKYNAFYDFSKYGSTSSTFKVTGVYLVKSFLTRFTTEDVAKDNLLSVFSPSYWNNTLRYVVENDGVRYSLPSDGLFYYNYAKVYTSTYLNMATLDLEFDAPGVDLSIRPCVKYANSQAVTITSDMTSISLPLTTNNTLNSNNGCDFGFYIKNESGTDINFKLKRMKVTLAS